MTSQRNRGLHRPLSSLSDIPSTEEDLSKPSAWEEQAPSTLVPSGWKGKGRQLPVDDEDDEDEDEDEDRESIDEDFTMRRRVSYPPVAEDDLESRKIEENLKRWETFEKQRRKKARESRLSIHKKSDSISSTFTMSGVGKRASQLWTRDSSRQGQGRLNPHQVLEDSEDSSVIAMAPPSASSPNQTPRASITVTDDPFRSTNENPFENPQYTANMNSNSTVSLNSPPGTPTPTPTTRLNSINTGKAGAADKGKGKYPGKPQPLDLPVRIDTPVDHAAQRGELEEEVDGRQRAWWTEWLCGCREEGDEQAARTNPME